MKLTFIGSAASEGYPDAFCACTNCERARELGGPNLRKRSAALVDGELLLDLGPVVMDASQMHGVSLAGVRYCLLTHDHFDPSHLWSRSSKCGVLDVPCLELYATRGALKKAAEALGASVQADGFREATPVPGLNLRVCPVEPGLTFVVGPYRVTAVPTVHDPDVVPLLYVIERDGRVLFYATDTGPLPQEAWRDLGRRCGRFNVVVLDYTFEMGERSTGHLNAEQFLEQISRLRRAGLLADDCRIFAHHLAHHSNPDHDTLSAFATERGYDVAYDGLSITI